MSRDYIEYGLPWGWRYKRVARAINDAETNVAVIGTPGALIAFGIMSYPEDEAHLQLLAVRAANQKRGVGSALLAWLETVARTAGAQRIRVEARADNLAARNFYSTHGYDERRTQKSRYGGNVDGVYMEKWLRNASQFRTPQ
ncbi:MAG: GNAT family N-acetyltransferase [Burkholderiales bacterium]